MGTRVTKFQSSESLCKHRQNFIISFISPVLSSVSYEVQHSFSTFGVARNDIFFRRYLEQSYKSLQHDVNYLGTRFLSTCYSNFWWIRLNYRSPNSPKVSLFSRDYFAFPQGANAGLVDDNANTH